MRWRKPIWGISQLDYWASLDWGRLYWILGTLSACMCTLDEVGLFRVSIQECSHEDMGEHLGSGVQEL